LAARLEPPKASLAAIGDSRISEGRALLLYHAVNASRRVRVGLKPPLGAIGDALLALELGGQQAECGLARIAYTLSHTVPVRTRFR
jgi:hypothetical protein